MDSMNQIEVSKADTPVVDAKEQVKAAESKESIKADAIDASARSKESHKT